MKRYKQLFEKLYRILQVPESKVAYDKGYIFTCSIKGRCEENAFNYAKERKIFLVKGYAYENDFPIEHWWVYDPILKQHIEVTTSKGWNKNSIRKGYLIPYKEFKNKNSLKELLPISADLSKLISRG